MPNKFSENNLTYRSINDIITDNHGDCNQNENLNTIKNGATKCSDPNDHVNLCLKGGTMIETNFNIISNKENQTNHAENASQNANGDEKIKEIINAISKSFHKLFENEVSNVHADELLKLLIKESTSPTETKKLIQNLRYMHYERPGNPKSNDEENKGSRIGFFKESLGKIKATESVINKRFAFIPLLSKIFNYGDLLWFYEKLTNAETFAEAIAADNFEYIFPDKDYFADLFFTPEELFYKPPTQSETPPHDVNPNLDAPPADADLRSLNDYPKLDNENLVETAANEDVSNMCSPISKSENNVEVAVATGTDGLALPNENSNNIIHINKAEANDASADNNFYTNLNAHTSIKGQSPERNSTVILNENENNVNLNIAENPNPTDNNAENASQIAHNGENNKNSNDVAPATQNSKKSKYTNFPKKDYSGFVFAHAPQNYFESILTAYGLVFRNLMEGKIRRCGNQKNPKSDAGWYKYYQNCITTSKGEELIYLHGFYGDWSSGEGTQRINITNFDFENKNYDTEYLKEIKKHAEEAKKKQAEYAAEVEKQIIAEREKAAEKATELYNYYCDDYDCLFTAENPHPYLEKKCLFFDIQQTYIKVINSSKADEVFGYRLANKKGKLNDGEWLVIPIYNRNKNGIRSLQFIDNTGNKIMLKGGEAGGGYFEIKSNTDTNKYIISEGVADALVLNQILPNYNVIVAFSANNLSKVVGDIVKTTPNADIVIFADRDEKSKTGETEAIKAITAHDGRYILPPADIKDFCDFYTIEIQKNSNSDEVISIIKKYIENALTKSFPLFRSIQRAAESKLIFERKNSKDDDKLGKIVATSQNAITALLCPEYCGFDFLFEERSNNIEIIDYVITKKDANGNEILYFDKNANAKPRPLNDADYSKIKSRLEFHTNNNPTGFQEINTNSILRGVTELVASRKKYNKIKNFINSLPKLSGEKLLKAIDKLDNLFIYYANADVERFPAEYYKVVARCFATQIIARCLTEKGCKADYVPILQGEQGAKKSEFVMSLIHDENLIADVDFDNNTDDIVRKISGKIIGLIDEMNGFGKKQASFVKKFITFKEDTYVPKYKEFPTTIIRSVTFIGTTNEEHFLNDPTGERRYYPIPIFKGKETRFLSLQNDILEIFSAALYLYNEDKKIGNIITPDGKEVVHNGVLYHEMEKWNKVVAGEFKVINPYLHDISKWLNTKFADTKNDFITNKDIKEPDYFNDWQCPKDFEYLIINDVARWALGILPQNYNLRTHGVNITDALFNSGYIKTSKRIKGKVMPVFIRVKTEEDGQNEPENENKKPVENDVDIPF